MADPIVDARELVAELFPDARWAVLSASVLSPYRTAGSDLDIVVVVLPDGDPRAPYRQSRTYRGWPVELFVHDGQTLAHYLATDIDTRRPALHRMVATGAVLFGEDDADGRRVRSACARVLAEGPTPLSAAELDRARYGLTDGLDDLIHVLDDGERIVITAATWTRCAEVALAIGRHWMGSGKWLLRELRDLDAELATRWLAAAGDPGAVTVLAREVLERAGGPLFDGYKAAGERPVTH